MDVFPQQKLKYVYTVNSMAEEPVLHIFHGHTLKLLLLFKVKTFASARCNAQFLCHSPRIRNLPEVKTESFCTTERGCKSMPLRKQSAWEASLTSHSGSS